LIKYNIFICYSRRVGAFDVFRYSAHGGRTWPGII